MQGWDVGMCPLPGAGGAGEPREGPWGDPVLHGAGEGGGSRPRRDPQGHVSTRTCEGFHAHPGCGAPLGKLRHEVGQGKRGVENGGQGGMSPISALPFRWSPLSRGPSAPSPADSQLLVPSTRPQHPEEGPGLPVSPV